MRKVVYVFTVFTLVMFISPAVFAQENEVDYAIVTKIKEEGFNRSKVMEIMFNLTDVCGPRLTGSANLNKSQDWVIAQLNTWNINQAFKEPWGNFGRGWEIEKSYLALKKPYYQPLIAVPKAWTGSTNGLYEAEAVLINSDSVLDEAKYKGKLTGKAVVITSRAEVKLNMEPEAKRYNEEDLKDIFMNKMEDQHEKYTPEEIERYKKGRQFRQKLNTLLTAEKPAFILSSRGGTMGTFYTTNGASYAKDAETALPEFEMSTEHLNRLRRLLEAGEKTFVEAEVKTTFTDIDSIQYNVIAEIPGTDKNLKSEVVMLGAHLDSWHAATGATDNAAGCAVVMEALRILKSIDAKPRRTIRMVLWSGEEQGLLGSGAYVKKHFSDPETMALKPEHEKVSAYYNLDNGGGKIRGIYLQENEALRPVFESWFNPFRDLGAATVSSKNTGSTDHIPFDKVGIPGLQFIQDPMDYFNKTHHTNMDTFDRIQKDDLKQAAVILASIVYHTAMRNGKLPRKPLPNPSKGEKH